jgi:hypothetical protein
MPIPIPSRPISTDLQEDVEGRLDWQLHQGLSIYDENSKWKQIKTPTADANPVYPIMDIFRDRITRSDRYRGRSIKI